MSCYLILYISRFTHQSWSYRGHLHRIRQSLPTCGGFWIPGPMHPPISFSCQWVPTASWTRLLRVPEAFTNPLQAHSWLFVLIHAQSCGPKWDILENMKGNFVLGEIKHNPEASVCERNALNKNKQTKYSLIISKGFLRRNGRSGQTWWLDWWCALRAAKQSFSLVHSFQRVCCVLL